jgi:hypothetical protein
MYVCMYVVPGTSGEVCLLYMYSLQYFCTLRTHLPVLHTRAAEKLDNYPGNESYTNIYNDATF